ncbi:MAG TPA: GPR1/FUN34/YaaH family transporter [Syntrophomonadaceae bacterium]|nr:GPR1/FUN34/YaaH family transporter [Syntrophomonadaceae bacterium]
MSGIKGWANPAPAGLVALAMACFCFFALLTGKVTSAAIPLLGCWLLGGFVVQITVGIIEMLEGNTTGGNVFTFFAAFFMLVGGMEFLLKYFAGVNGLVLDTRIDGWAWATLAIALIMWTPAYLKQSPLIMSLVVLFLDVALPLIALMDMKVISSSFGPIAGISLLIAGILALYVSSSIILNTAFERQVLPMPGPMLK